MALIAHIMYRHQASCDDSRYKIFETPVQGTSSNARGHTSSEMLIDMLFFQDTLRKTDVSILYPKCLLMK